MLNFELFKFILLSILFFAFGYLTGVIRTRNYYTHSYKALVEQLYYWRYRYLQTLQDYQNLAEEKQWFKDWCPEPPGALPEPPFGTLPDDES